jgi:anion-transporting  ArsA/GET3 family ATPase
VRAAAPPLIDTLLAKRLVLVTGKGGIGKTVVAAALGQAAAAAASGTASTLISESALTDQVAPLFGHPAVGHRETEVQPGLFSINLDPPLNFRDYVVKYLRQPGLYDRVFSNRLVQSFIDTVPGFAELMMLGRTFYTSELAPEPRPRFIAFDAYASGHFLSLMTTPDAVLAAGFGGPLASETERVKAFLADPDKTAVVYVVTPEELVVSEALDFIPKLVARSPARLAGVIVNRVPAPAPAASRSLGAGGQAAMDFLAARQARAQAAIGMLRSGLDAFADAGMRIDGWMLPDLGAVPEPLPAGFGSHWLRSGGPL